MLVILVIVIAVYSVLLQSFTCAYKNYTFKLIINRYTGDLFRPLQVAPTLVLATIQPIHEYDVCNQ